MKRLAIVAAFALLAVGCSDTHYNPAGPSVTPQPVPANGTCTDIHVYLTTVSCNAPQQPTPLPPGTPAIVKGR